MPKLCHARAPTDPAEAAQIRKLAHSYHAPYDCKQRAQMVALSWEGLRHGRNRLPPALSSSDGT